MDIDLRKRGNDCIQPQQTNFRIDPSDADKFRQFCATSQITQAEGFRLMVSLMGDKPVREVVDSAIEMRNAWCAEIEKLKSALHKVSMEKKRQAKQLKRARRAKFLEVQALAGINCCRAFSEAQCEECVPIFSGKPDPVLSYRKGLKRDARQYHYLSAEGSFFFFFEFAAYSEPKSIMVYGHTLDGIKIKFRVWPDRNYTPICSTASLLDSKYLHAGNQWLIALAHMPHGFLELICAMPVPGYEPNTWPTPATVFDQDAILRELEREQASLAASEEMDKQQILEKREVRLKELREVSEQSGNLEDQIATFKEIQKLTNSN